MAKNAQTKKRRPILPVLVTAALLVPGGWCMAYAAQQSQAQDRSPAAQQGQQTQQQDQRPPQQTQPQGQQQDQQNRNQQQGANQQPALVLVNVSVPVYSTTAGAIADEPALFYGSLVSVQAEIEDVKSPHLFTLDEDRIGAGPDVPVLAARPAGLMPENEVVTVIGHVRPLVASELDRDYDWFDSAWLTPLGVQREVRPMIVAVSIIDRNGRQLLREPVGAAR